MTALATKPAEIPQLTGLRAVLAWWVVTYHVAKPELAGITLGVLDPLRTHGYLAVDGFFILSGFILAYAYRDRFVAPAPGTYPRFLIARLARIYPVHLVVTACFVVLIMGGQALTSFRPRIPERFGLDELLLHVSLLHGWGFSRRLAWNYPSWSISAEWFAYLCFPIVHRLVLRASSALWPTAVAVLALLGLGVFEQLGPAGNLSYTYNFALLRIGFEFVGGAALFMLARRWIERPPAPGPARRPHAIIALLAAMAGMFGAPDAAVVGCLGLAIFFLSHPRDMLAPLLAGKRFVYAGETSYSVYMVHALIEGMGVLALRGMPALEAAPNWLRLVGVVVVVQLAAHQLWRRVEQPGRDLGRRAGEAMLARFLPLRRSA